MILNLPTLSECLNHDRLLNDSEATSAPLPHVHGNLIKLCVQ